MSGPASDADRVALRMEAPPEDGPFLALAVSCVRRRPLDLWHIGILYRSGDGQALRLLEMLGDQWLRDVDASDASVGLTARYAWAPLPLSAHDREVVLARFALVGSWVRQHGPSVRLGFAYAGEPFDATTGAWTHTAGVPGLYCSTTVLALFQSVGIALIDRPAWPHRPEMDTWIQCFAEILREHGEYHQRTVVLGEVPCVVFHPRAVMGVCLSGRVGIDADEADAYASTLEAQYQALRPERVR